VVGEMVIVDLNEVVEAIKEKDKDDDGYEIEGIVETLSSEEEENFGYPTPIAKCKFSRLHPPWKSSKPNKQDPHLTRSPVLQPRKSKCQPPRIAHPTSKSSNPKHTSTPCRSKVTFSDFTAHIPLIQPPTPSHTDHLKLRQLRLHSPYTTAETTRGRLTIQRSCALYTIGTWASPEGCEKADTSLMNEDWEYVEHMWGIETRIQETETQEGLHIRSWMWVLIWWAKEVRKRGVVCKGKGKRVLVEDVRGRMEDAGLWL